MRDKREPKIVDKAGAWRFALAAACVFLVACIFLYAATHAKPSSRPVQRPQGFVGSSEQ